MTNKNLWSLMQAPVSVQNYHLVNLQLQSFTFQHLRSRSLKKFSPSCFLSKWGFSLKKAATSVTSNCVEIWKFRQDLVTRRRHVVELLHFTQAKQRGQNSSNSVWTHKNIFKCKIKPMLGLLQGIWNVSTDEKARNISDRFEHWFSKDLTTATNI